MSDTRMIETVDTINDIISTDGPQHYTWFDHTMLTVEQERALFSEWCDYLGYLRATCQITQSAYCARRDHLERWYAWIGNTRDRAYMERAGIVQLELFEAQS